jgi:cation:H+ antiporter
MMMSIVLFLAGLPLLLVGASILVKGASGLALRMGLSEMAVGLTVVAMGTSMPELIVSLLSALKGSTDLAVGNVIGSNISNILLILGLSALITPLALEDTLRWREIPFVLLATVVLAALANDHLLAEAQGSSLNRGDGIALLGFFAIYMYYVFSLAKQGVVSEMEVSASSSVSRNALFVVVGVAALTLGGHWMVQGAGGIARLMGLSEAFIGLTIVAVGTSLPELATSTMAAIRGNADMAVGNVVGSNVYNVLFILGITGTVTPVEYNVGLNTDMWILLGVTGLFFAFTFTGRAHKIDRWEGVLFLLLYGAYLTFLVIRG